MENILIRNNVKIIGNGTKILLFAHGYGCDQNVWADVVPAFVNDYKLVLFDYVGAGCSQLMAYDKDRYANLSGYAQDIIEICDALNIQGAILIAHSVSGMIGVLASNQQPELFEKMIFLGPSPRYLNDEGYHGGFERKDLEDLFEVMDNNYLGWSAAMGPAIMGNPDRPELGEALTKNFCSTDPEIAKQFARVTFLSDNRADLPYVKVPTLTVQCKEDIVAPLEVGNYIKRHTPQNSLVIIEATGHCSHMSAPVETVEAIKAFLVDK